MNEQLMVQMLSSYPQLLPACKTTRAIIRHEHWVVVKNPTSGELVRLHRDLWSLVTLLDGKTRVRQWLDEHGARYGEQRLLSAVLLLQRAGIVQTGVDLPQASVGLIHKLMRRNPLMIRFALLDPTGILDKLCSYNYLLSTRVLTLTVMLSLMSAVYIAIMHGQGIVEQWRTVTDSPQMWYYFLLYPLAKCLHEFSHGWALRRAGAEVPEAGICFLVMFPLPYVDASDAWMLPRYQRMWVTAAGMLMDSVLACAGLVLWATLASGVLADISFTFFLMGSVSVVFFNANPLLKFDGYYLLEDVLDSPGLSRRAGMLYRYLCKRYLLAVQDSRPPVLASGETAWLLMYGAASTLYRFFIATVICVFLITTFYELGVLLSLFCLIPLVLVPAFRLVSFLCVSRELDECRARVVATTITVLVLLGIFVFVVPLPSSTRTQGVVWVDEQAEVYAAHGGQIEQLLVGNGDKVQAGQALIELVSDTLALQLEQQGSAVRLAELDVIRYRQSDPGKARSATISLQQARTELDHTRSQIEKLIVRAPSGGVVVLGKNKVLEGASVEQGDLLLYVVNEKQRVVRAVVAQSAMGRVEQGIHRASIRLPQAMHRQLPVKVARQMPSGDHQLPSEALVNRGFGGFAVEEQQGDLPLRTRDKVFHLELTLDNESRTLQTMPMGTRAFVTLEHASEPIVRRLYRLSRQLLLKQLSV